MFVAERAYIFNIQHMRDLEENYMSRRIHQVIKKGDIHWVGDGFPVSTLFSYYRTANISPFLLLDYASPMYFDPADSPRGVEKHPHRGFETVTIVYEGEVEHRDTAGNSGSIGPGDVQWMTAARGVLHEEMHSKAFTKSGGVFEVVQLWVNLPAKDKMSDPHYQPIQKSDIPVVENKGSTIRVIAGSVGKTKGAAKTFTPVSLYDVALEAGASLKIEVTDGHNAMLLVRSGALQVGGAVINAAELVQFEQSGNSITITADSDAAFLFMAGEPIYEPVVGKGPFVMNTEEEIGQAFSDFRAGKFQ